MATRIEEILIRCRDSLADEDKSRWSDARLLRLVDEAQKKIATKAQLLRRNITISVLANQAEYELPSDAFLITRVVNSGGQKIEVKSHADMDDFASGDALYNPTYSIYRGSSQSHNIGAMWEIDTGSEVQFIIFDNQEPGFFKTYPIVNATVNGEIFVIGSYGVVGDIELDTLSSPYGVVGDLTTNAVDLTQFNSAYGVVADMSEVTEFLKVYYRAKPSDVTSELDILEIDDKWDAAIKHYVVGMALHDDQDTQNRSVSADEMAMYGIEFQDAKKISSKDNMSRSGNRTTYNSEI